MALRRTQGCTVAPSYTPTYTFTPTPTATPPFLKYCDVSSLGTLSSGATVSGVWEVSCLSTHRWYRYARYYAFTLDADTDVRIDLSSPVDTYLYLMDGSGKDGSVNAQNDNISDTNLNSRIDKRLSAGTYTIEATTNAPGQIGGFTMSILPTQ